MSTSEKSAWVVETGDTTAMPKALAYTPTVQDSTVDLLCEQFAAMHLGAIDADNAVPMVMGDSVITTINALALCLFEFDQQQQQQWQTSIVRSASLESLPKEEDTPIDQDDEVMEPTLGESMDNNSSSSTMAGDSSVSQTAILDQSLQNMEANTLTNGALHDMNFNSSEPVQQVPVVCSSEEEQREVVDDSAAVVNEVDGASLAADVNETPLFLWPAEEFLAVVDGNAVGDTAAIQSAYLDMMFSNSSLDMLGAGAPGDTPPVGDVLGDSTSGDNIYGDETLGAEFAYLFNHVNTSVTSDSNQVNASATSGNDATSVHPDNSAAVGFPPLAPPSSTVEDVLGGILVDVPDDSEYDAFF
ncbi:hypothetical protein BDA99DRAFT_559084 [Phascolomyces articulosus]|uniref:Uncharacterized protein n=1 Tax=Phascolomyces articulosus TaxID=60185 RepID=A0AAD5KBY8_9FUNG|nr:hypothetical protein BDA99DRAFT_559084 [Phascolomyces articulosus]